MTASTDGQRKGRRIALTPLEMDEFLETARTCRVATVRAGRPHVSPLWFVWYEGALWLYSIVNSQRFRDVQLDPAVAVVVDDGAVYRELRGVEVLGTASVVGEVPRTGQPVPGVLEQVERIYARKYQDRDDLRLDGRHAWLRVEVQKVVSWDFRKMDSS